MTKISLTVHDAEVRTAIQHATMAVQNLPAKVVRPEVEQARRDLVEPYPPELPGQKYIRTGRRYQATKVQATIGSNQYSKTYAIVSNPHYRRGQTGNPYVLGDARGQGQARIHQGRWTTLFDAMNRAIERIIEKGNEYFRSVLEHNGPP